MKHLKLVGLFVLSISIFACGGDSKTDSTDEKVNETTVEESKPDTKGMEMVDLSEYDIPATIYVPDESKSKRMITATEWGSVEIESGKRYGIEIIPSGMSVVEKKEELNNASIYEVKITSESADKLVYTKTIPGTELEPEVHFFMTADINGEVYSVASMSNSYNEKAVEKMINSASTLTAK